MLDFLQNSFLTYGYYILFFGSLLEGVIFTGLFVPGGLLVLLGGYFAKTSGSISFVGVVLLSWFGMFLGDLINYYFGKSIWQKYFSKSRFFERLAQIHLFGEEERISRILSKWGTWAIFYSHIVGAFRSVVGFFAGMSAFPIRRYIISIFFASFFWSVIFTSIGYFVAEATDDLRDLNNTITFFALGLLILVLLLRWFGSFIITFFTSRYIARRMWQQRIVRVMRAEKFSLRKILRRIFLYFKR